MSEPGNSPTSTLYSSSRASYPPCNTGQSIPSDQLEDQDRDHRYSNPEVCSNKWYVESPTSTTGPAQEPSGDARGELNDGAEIEKDLTSLAQTETRNANLVTWEGPSDPENPKNWTTRRKWAATIVGIPPEPGSKSELTAHASFPLHSHLSRLFIHGCPGS